MLYNCYCTNRLSLNNAEILNPNYYQFKNKFTLSNLLYHKQDHGCSADWNFFATAHGKGPVDDMGGQVKRSVWRCTLQGKYNPDNAEGFFEIAKREMKLINIL